MNVGRMTMVPFFRLGKANVLIVAIFSCCLCLASFDAMAQSSSTLSEALDSDLNWATSTSYEPFVGQTNFAHDGIDAAFVTVNLTAFNLGFLNTSITGPCRVGFWWWYNATNSAQTSFTVTQDGVTVAQAQKGQWTSNYIDVPSGSHNLHWAAYCQYPNLGALSAALDEVSVSPLPGPALTVTTAGDQLTISWPLTETTFVLESADSSQGPFSDAGLTPQTAGGINFVTFSPTSQQKVFRLRSQ